MKGWRAAQRARRRRLARVEVGLARPPLEERMSKRKRLTSFFEPLACLFLFVDCVSGYMYMLRRWWLFERIPHNFYVMRFSAFGHYSTTSSLTLCFILLSAGLSFQASWLVWTRRTVKCAMLVLLVAMHLALCSLQSSTIMARLHQKD